MKGPGQIPALPLRVFRAVIYTLTSCVLSVAKTGIIQSSQRPVGPLKTHLHNDGIHAGSRHLAGPLLHQLQLLIKHWGIGAGGWSNKWKQQSKGAC